MKRGMSSGNGKNKGSNRTPPNQTDNNNEGNPSRQRDSSSLPVQVAKRPRLNDRSRDAAPNTTTIAPATDTTETTDATTTIAPSTDTTDTARTTSTTSTTDIDIDDGIRNFLNKSLKKFFEKKEITDFLEDNNYSIEEGRTDKNRRELFENYIRDFLKFDLMRSNQATFPIQSRKRGNSISVNSNEQVSNRRSVMVEDHDITNYDELFDKPEDGRNLRHLRWVSSYAYAWLLLNGTAPPVEEVQALWDGSRIHMAENKNANTRTLQDAFNGEKFPVFTDTDMNKLKKLLENDPLRYQRLERHLNAVKDSSDNVVNAFKNKEVNYVIGALDPVHAEAKIVESLTKYADKKFVVAGIKRPCLACFARLRRAAVRISRDGGELLHKPRHGLFWPSQNALRGLTPQLEQALLQEIHDATVYHRTQERITIDSDSEESDSMDS